MAIQSLPQTPEQWTARPSRLTRDTFDVWASVDGTDWILAAGLPGRTARLMAVAPAMADLLSDCEGYLGDRADVYDGDDGQPRPDRALQLLARVQDLLALNIRAAEQGVRNGWFVWPANFDPVWLEQCDGFEPIGSPASPTDAPADNDDVSLAFVQGWLDRDLEDVGSQSKEELVASLRRLRDTVTEALRKGAR